MKWIVLLLVVGGLVLASGPAFAQDTQPPSQLQKLYWQELAKYYHLIEEYNRWVEAQQSVQGGVGPHAGPGSPGPRQRIAQINAQHRKVQGLKKALEASEQGR